MTDLGLEGGLRGVSVGEPVVIVAGPGADTGGEDAAEPTGTIEEPAKVMRIGSMIKQLLDEVRHAPLDERSRLRLREIYQVSVRELGTSLSPDLREELAQLALPFGEEEIPTDAELRVAQAQLVGWLEGLFHGIQATLFAQQLAAQAQLNQMRQRQIGPGGPGGSAGLGLMGQGGGPGGGQDVRPGTYL